MAYSDLTSSEKEVLDNFINQCRGFAGDTAKLMVLCSSIIDAHSANVSGLIDSIDTGEVIQNKSGLAGVSDLTKEELVAFIGSMQAALAGFNTESQRQARVKLAGINA